MTFRQKRTNTLHDVCCGINILFQYFGSEVDVLGTLYESLLKDGKDLGQFFTPRNVVDIAVKYAKQNRELGSVLDPTCGTGAFLVRCNTAEKILGIDISARVLPITCCNVWLNLKTLDNIDIEELDFLEYDPRARFTTILSNPPFGLKGIKWSEYNNRHPDVFPVNTTATGLFLEKMIHHLEIGGRLCIVLPYGCEMCSIVAKSQKFRKALFACCDVKAVHLFGSKTFVNSGVKTCLLIMDKCRDMSNTFDTFCTRSIDIYRGEFELVKTVTIEQLECSYFSLNINLYVDYDEPIQSPHITNTRVRDLYRLTKGKVNSVEIEDGEYPVYTGKVIPHLAKIEHATFEGDNVVVSGMSDIGRSWCTSGTYGVGRHCYNMELIDGNNTILNKYVAHYLNTRKTDIQDRCVIGHTARRSLNKQLFLDYVIPIPTLETQKKIFKLHTAICHAKDMIEHYRSVIHIIMENSIFRDTTNIRMRDLCKLKNGKHLTKDEIIPGPYLVVGGGAKPMGKHCEYNIEANEIIIAKDGSVGVVSKYPTQTFLTNHACHLIEISDSINKTFLYHYLKTISQQTLLTFRQGAAQPHLDVPGLYNFNIKVPSCEVQTKTCYQIELYETRITKLEEDIIEFDRLADETFTMLLMF